MSFCTQFFSFLKNFIKKLSFFLSLVFFIFFFSFVFGLQAKPNTCNSCHSLLEPIKDNSSQMMQEIFQRASDAGYPKNDCIVCHGGNPEEKDKQKAHAGTVSYFRTNKGPKEFYPDPGSPWINQNTCGVCHTKHVAVQKTSLMFTEAGKIQGALWGFGVQNDYQHNNSNYEGYELGLHEKLGTSQYKKYMKVLQSAEPQIFPLKTLPLKEAPKAHEVEKDPKLAVYTYLRQECQRCHTGNKGRTERGDYRGMGCSSCHIPYGNEGLYEGADTAISNTTKGHILVHSLQGTRDSVVRVHGQSYSGIPVETCTTCHDRGKRIGTSYQGLMETSFGSPYGDGGKKQEKLHSKNYLHLQEDIHLTKGMLCQDCHTSEDAHGNGFLVGTTLGAVEIECQDCHGTLKKYPWELPLGYSDEIVGAKLSKTARGLSFELLEYIKQGTEYPPEDGYLISARGNPLANVVKKDNRVLVHTASGRDLWLKPLKLLFENDELSPEALTAMGAVEKHMESLECYTCHASWAPQCYGCHIKVDYSEGKKGPDWLAMGHHPNKNGLTPDALGFIKEYMIDGQVTEQRSYLRWENPALVVNGENRVSPGVPGCQTTLTVVGETGRTLLQNHIFRVPHVEGGGPKGQLALDISPIQPHTVQKKARSCENCHLRPESMGYGISGGGLYADPSQPYKVDLMSAQKALLSQNHKTQIEGIPNLSHDWSRFVTEKGETLQTVGHHFKASRALNQKERALLDRREVCQSCHEMIPQGDLAMSVLHHIKEAGGIKFDQKGHKKLITKITLLSGWIQVLAGFLGGLCALIFIIYQLRFHLKFRVLSEKTVRIAVKKNSAKKTIES